MKEEIRTFASRGDPAYAEVYLREMFWKHLYVSFKLLINNMYPMTAVCQLNDGRHLTNGRRWGENDRFEYSQFWQSPSHVYGTTYI